MDKQYILDHGSDVAAAEHNGETALMLTTHGGQEAVAAAIHDGVPALMVAAAGGHEAQATMFFAVLMFAIAEHLGIWR